MTQLRAKNGPSLIVDVAIVNQETLDKRQSDVETIYRGWCKALEDLENNPDEAVRLMAISFKLEPEEFNDMRSGLRYINYDMNRAMFTKTNGDPPIVKTFKMAGEILTQNNLTKTVAEAEKKVATNIATMPLN